MWTNFTSKAIALYISPDGEVVHLSGGPGETEIGVHMGHGPEGLSDVDMKAIFDAAARQWGEEYVGVTLDHAEIDLPIFILGLDADDLRRRREHLKRIIERDRVGWLAIFTNTTGWRWVAVRKKTFKPDLSVNRDKGIGVEIDVVLIVERPLARCADHADHWKNTHGTGRGTLTIDPGPEWHGWPQLALQGPGSFRIAFAGNDFTTPTVLADERILINTDEARPTIRSVRSDGTVRNLMPEIRGMKFTNPAPADEVTRIDLTVTGGNSATEAWVVVSHQIEGLL